MLMSTSHESNLCWIFIDDSNEQTQLKQQGAEHRCSHRQRQSHLKDIREFHSQTHPLSDYGICSVSEEALCQRLHSLHDKIQCVAEGAKGKGWKLH